jgi:FdhD protein
MSDPDARTPPALTPTREVEVTRVGPAGAVRTRDLAAAEEPLDVRLHGRSFAVIMRTPGEDRALAAGFLLSERIIASAADIGAIEHCRHPDQTRAHHVVDVFLVGGAAARVPALLERRRQVIANSSCGICGRATIEELAADLRPLPMTTTMTVAAVGELPGRLRSAQTRFDETGGLHGAALFGADGSLLGSAEDVGRHNAVDKVLGAFLLDDPAVPFFREKRGQPPFSALMVSGRVSFEIVQKAWLGGVQIVAAISAPTSLAIELADAAGITLLGFVRESGLNIYTHTARIEGV